MNNKTTTIARRIAVTTITTIQIATTTPITAPTIQSFTKESYSMEFA
jgi:phage antirepressor YoqD-like protein